MPLHTTPPGFPLTNATPGRQLDLKAYDWQAITQAVQNGQAPPPLPPLPAGHGYNAAPQYILVKNTDPDNHWLWSGSAFALGDCLTPHYHYQQHSPGEATPPDSLNHDWLALFAGRQTENMEPGQFAIAVDSIAPGEIGRAVFDGLAWVIWHQYGQDWPNHPNGRKLDYVGGVGSAMIGYTERGYPGRGHILWAPAYNQAGYVLGLAYFGTPPPYSGDFSTWGSTSQNIPPPTAGAFELVLRCFDNLTQNTTGCWFRQSVDVVRVTKPGIWRLDYQCCIYPAYLQSPWPDNNPPVVQAHAYRLLAEQSTSPTFASGIGLAGFGYVDRFTVYPGSVVTAEGFTYAHIETVPTYLRLKLSGNFGGSPASYGLVNRSQFAARWAGGLPDPYTVEYWQDF